MTEQNKAISRRVAEEFFAGGNLELTDELFDSNVVWHDVASPEPVRGRDAIRQQVQLYREAFPDLELTIDDELAEDDRVATRWTARGTHQGELFGIAPTGKQTTVEGMTIDRFSGGKIVESWNNWDTLGLMQQLGVVPQTAQA